MKKISEMTEDEVRDYALQLEQEKDANSQAIAEKDKTIADLKDDVVSLQRRNNSLFMKIEQQKATPSPEDEGEEEQTESMDDFIKNNYKEYLK
jgi:hypothetical protein